MSKPWTLLVAITVTVSPDLSRRMTVGTSNTCLVTTVAGDVEGLDLGTSCAFLGIPYAASTAGANRWKPPQARAPWAPAIHQAKTSSPNCGQVQQPATATGFEDCLFLNIWTR